MNLTHLIMPNPFFNNVINCELVRHKTLVAIKSDFSIYRKENMQIFMSVLDLQTQLYTENS